MKETIQIIGRWIPLGLAIAVLTTASVGLAQSVTVSADARDLYAGLPFAMAVSAEGFDSTPQPEAPTVEIADCDVTFAGAAPRTMRSVALVNGKRVATIETTFVFRYQVTPKRAGTFKIPPIVVSAGKKSGRSQQRTFIAKKVARTNKMRIALVLPERPVWLGETFELAIDWYLAVDPSRPTFSIPMFEDADRFTVSSAEPGRKTRRRQVISFPTIGQPLELGYDSKPATIDGKDYTRLRFRALVTPSVAGTLEIGTAKVVSALETGQARDKFGFPVSKTEVFEAIDKARTLEVKALPQTGRPASFNSAVGTGFSIDVVASRTVVRVGDPIELTVTVRSETNLGGMALPASSILLPAEQFVTADEDVIGELRDDGKIKVFQLIAQLKSKDVREVPPLELAYFNPIKGSYEVARSQPIALQVAGSSLVDATSVTRPSASNGGSSNNGASTSAVTLVGADLALSSIGSTLDRPASLGKWVPLLAALYVLPLAFFGFVSWRRRTAGDRAASGAKRKRTSAFDQALSSAATEPKRSGAKSLAAELRALAKEAGNGTGGDAQWGADLENVLAELDVEAYNPRAGKEPVGRDLLTRAREVGQKLSGTLGFLLLLGGSLVVGLPAAHADEGASLGEARVHYEQALATDDAETARHLYARAQEAFAVAVEASPDRPELLVDWGNAALGARDVGWAVLAFRRALTLDTGHSRASSNLSWARSKMPDWVPKPSSDGAVSTLLFWRDASVVSLHLVAAFAFAFAVLLLIPFGGRAVGLSRVIGSGALGIVFVLAILPAIFRADDSSAGVVVRDAEVLRAADSPNAPEALPRPLPAGVEVEILESRERWVQVELANGTRGWLPRTAIERVSQGS